MQMSDTGHDKDSRTWLPAGPCVGYLIDRGSYAGVSKVAATPRIVGLTRAIAVCYRSKTARSGLAAAVIVARMPFTEVCTKKGSCGLNFETYAAHVKNSDLRSECFRCGVRRYGDRRQTSADIASNETVIAISRAVICDLIGI